LNADLEEKEKYLEEKKKLADKVEKYA